QVSQDGTEKYLWDLGDGEAVESVLIPEGKRRTLCISSQVGCALGCVFCATGRMGFRRNLSVVDIASQVREVMLLDAALKPTNVVFMGMGEPLLNWDAVDRALTILNHADALGIGARHITVSTVGILPNIAKLAQRPEQFRLALSLHAPTPELRHELMPIEKKYTLPAVIAALARFRRRVTLEYVLIGGKNDALEQADQLAQLAQPLGALVNLLPLHPGVAPDLSPSPGVRRAFRTSTVTRGPPAPPPGTGSAALPPRSPRHAASAVTQAISTRRARSRSPRSRGGAASGRRSPGRCDERRPVSGSRR